MLRSRTVTLSMTSSDFTENSGRGSCGTAVVCADGAAGDAGPATVPPANITQVSVPISARTSLHRDPEVYIQPVRERRSATVAVNKPIASISMNGVLLAVCGNRLRAGVVRPVGS